MRILYIHQYFKTPLEPGGTRSYWIAKELIKNGHEVTMLTTKSGLKSDVEHVNIDGIKVIYLNVPYNNKMGLVQRALAFVKFMFKSTAISLKQKDVDLIISTSTPLTVGFPALIMKKLKRIPFVFEVRDLWPEVPVQMGGIKNPMIISTLRWFEKLIYRNATHIVALSPGMYDGVKSVGINVDKISMIPNMSKIDEFWARDRNMDLAKELGLKENSFKVVHFGTLGLANGAMSIIDSAILLKDRQDIEFVFVGGGSTEKDLKDKCRDNNLNNVVFLGKFPMSTTSEIVNLCDVSIVSFMDLPILYTNSPNKLFDSLSAGKPIIVNSAGWTKDLVEDYKCGFYVDPKIPQDLADKVIFLSENPETVQQMGLASRDLAVNKYDKSILCRQFNNVISGLNIKSENV